jgi:LacI family transcriptional regulator
MNMQKITIDDVAEKCGFSRATVSRVINREGTVKPATAEKVEKAVQELGYTPNLMARALSGGNSRTIAVLLPDLVMEYHTALLAGADAAAEEKGYNLIIKTRNTNKALIDLVEGRRVDAFLLRFAETSSFDLEFLSLLKKRKIPYIIIGKPPFSDDNPSVLIDNIGGARLMAKHYAMHGFQRILFITGTEESFDSQDRIYGFKIGLSEQGIDPANVIIVRGDFSRQSGCDAVRTFLETDRADAVFAANDHMALGVMRYCQEIGMRVPEDIAVTGFDDIFFAEYLQPSLTTVQQPMHAIGDLAVENLIQMIEGGRARESQIILPTKLQVRHSCGC